jgi:SSS family solute:Na+ symporter
MNWSAFTVFIILFAIVTVMGFLASRWQRGDLSLLDEWGLAGRRFGTLVTWFLLGGDLYTAYTFIAVPALVYGAGAMGFFAVPYTIVVFPIMFLVMPRLWSVSKRHGYVTSADFVRGRYESRGLALAVAITGILATLPYIALQLVGMEAVFAAMGLTGTGLLADLPLVLAFALLAAYTYLAGLRAPALTAIAKDILIYVTVIVAVILIPIKLGGYGHIFSVAAAALPATKGALILSPKLFVAFSTLALGSAFALLLYPHVITGTLGARSGGVVRRNAALLPVYSLALGFIALLGFMAIAAGVKTKVTSLAVPLLFLKEFPSWFAGFAFAAVAVGALVPAAIMSIAAANLWTRNIYKEYVKPAATAQDESRVAKLVSLLVKLGALIFVVLIPTTYAIYLQTLGGIWILQTLPSVMLGLYTRWFHRTALLIGWAVGMILGTGMAAAVGFKTSIYPLTIGSLAIPGYAAVYAVIANLVVAVVLTWIFSASRVAAGRDETEPADYSA